jgi:hypothetical protein
VEAAPRLRSLHFSLFTPRSGIWPDPADFDQCGRAMFVAFSSSFSLS